MQPVISLRAFVDEMDGVSEEARVFLDIRTGRFMTRSCEAEDAAGALHFSDDLRELPDQFDIQEHALMQRFCNTLADEALRRGLLRSLQGRGASMRIRSTVHSYGVAEEWSAYRKEAFREIAIEWLEKHGVAWSDELDEPR